MTFWDWVIIAALFLLALAATRLPNDRINDLENELNDLKSDLKKKNLP
jgi:Sec-independent protein translocase protein TatA